MGGPSWLAGILAAVMIGTAAYCVTRLAGARRMRRPTEYDVDTVHVFMGVAMAGMLVPRLNPFWDSGWEVIFAAATAWFGWQIVRARRGHAADGQRPGHHVPHLLASGAMLYMFLAFSAAGAVGTAAGMAMGGAGAAHFPALGLAFLLALLGYVIWTTDQFTSLAPVAGLRPARAAEPVLAGSGAAMSAGTQTGLAAAERPGTAAEDAGPGRPPGTRRCPPGWPPAAR